MTSPWEADAVPSNVNSPSHNPFPGPNPFPNAEKAVELDRYEIRPITVHGEQGHDCSCGAIVSSVVNHTRFHRRLGHQVVLLDTESGPILEDPRGMSV
jgi:hypothetical protein